MVDLRWDGDDFRNSQDSSGATADKISHSGKLQQGYQHGSLTKGLVAYYSMEKGEGEILHDGALDNMGRINGASWSSESSFSDHSVFFSGSDDITLDYYGIGGKKARTVSFWMKSSLEDYQQFVFWGDASTSGEKYIIRVNHATGYYTLRVENTGGQLYGGSTATELTDGDWHHCVVVFPESGTDVQDHELYVDGTRYTDLEGSGQEMKTDTSTNKVKLGQNLEGNLKDVRIYNRALSQPEIKALYNVTQLSGSQVSEKDIPGRNQNGVSRYRFNGNLDDAWSSNNAVDNTSVSPGYVTGVYGQAKNFDGSDDWVDLDSIFLAGSTSFTVSEWFKADSTSYVGIFGMWDNDTTSNRRVQIFWRGEDSSGGRIIQFLARDNSGGYHNLDGNKSIEPGSGWHHVAVTYDGQVQRMFIDGSLDAQQSSSFTVNNDTTLTDRISDTPSNNNYRLDGAVDDLRIYSKALSPTQIEKIYHKGAYRVPREATLQ